MCFFSTAHLVKVNSDLNFWASILLELRVCSVDGCTRTHLKGRSLIHRGTLSKISPKAASLEIVKRATASNGASLQGCQSE
jgi:hypothetical protein